MRGGQIVTDERVAANGYQMSLEVEDDGRDVIDETVAQVASWLRTKKRWEPRLDTSGFQYQSAQNRDLLTLHHESSSGREFRMRLTEDTLQGVWRTQLTVSVPRSGDPWLALQVGNSEQRWASVPGLATNLLDTLRTRDGMSVVSSKALTVSPYNVEDFLERLTDPDRRGLYFVAGTAKTPFDFPPFAQQVGRWVREVRGLAQVVVLTPEATEIVAEALGPSHAVAAWTLRTFYPDVDPAIRSDGFRHKWLTTERLGKDPDRAIQQLLGRIARRHAYLRPPLEGYAITDRTLRRLEDRTLVAAMAATVPSGVEHPTLDMKSADAVLDASSTEAGVPHTVAELLEQAGPPVLEPPLADQAVEESTSTHGPATDRSPSLDETVAPQSHTTELAALLDLVRTTLGLTELTRESLVALARKAAQGESVGQNMKLVEAQLKEREAREAELESRVSTLQESFDDAQLGIRESDDDAARLRDENRYLKQRLAEREDFEGAYGAVPEDAYTRYPDSFDELLRRRSEFEAAGVIFTGNETEMLAMDEHDTLGNAVRAAWDGFLALVDYLRAREEGVCSTGVREYMRETPSGFRSMPSNKFGGKETKETMRRWGQERVFPVPTEVSATGEAVMEAHFKLAPIGMVSPRMYFLDCYATAGKVYVGYIGAHLTNTQS